MGATTGYAQLWLAIIAAPLLINILSICSRIGDVTKHGLAKLISNHFGRTTSLSVLGALAIANLITLGADFAGMAAGMKLLWPGLNIIWFLPITTLLIWIIIVFKSYQSLTKYLTLLVVIFVSYIITAFLTKPDWLQVFKAIVLPEIGIFKNYWLNAVAFLGTTITPFLFFWQVTEEVENHPSIKDVPSETKLVTPGIIYSSLISFFIILTAGAVLFPQNIAIASAADAAQALVPLAGQFAGLLFGLGLVVAGFIAIPVLTASTAYAISETFGWREGLNKPLREAKGFYLTISLALMIGLLIALSPISAIQALFYSQVVNGLLAPIVLIIIFLIARNTQIVHQYRISRKQTVMLLLTILLMIGSAIMSLRA